MSTVQLPDPLGELLVGSVDGRTGHHVGWRAAPRGLGRQVDGSRQVLAVGRTER